MGPDDEGRQDSTDDRTVTVSFSDIVERITAGRDGSTGVPGGFADQPTTEAHESRDPPPREEGSFSDLLSGLRERDDRHSRDRPEAKGDADDAAFPNSGDNADARVLREIVETASNILLRGPPGCPAEFDLCTTLIGSSESAKTKLLMVTVDQSPDERLKVCRGYLDEMPAETVIVNLGDPVRSDSTASIDEIAQSSTTIVSIPGSDDLSRLGIILSKYLSEWEAEGTRTVVCFHSLTPLLDHMELQTVFRFLHVLQGRIRDVGAFAHYHIDADAHREPDYRTLETLFDVVVDFDEDWTISVDR